jgi:hypothetical protein
MAEMRSKVDPEKRRVASVKTGLKNVEKGFFTLGHPNCILTFESQSAAGTLGGTSSYLKGVGLFDEAKKEERRKLGIGEFSEETREIRSQNAKAIAGYLMENKLGVFSPKEIERTRERGREYADKKVGLFAEENLGKGARVCKEKKIGIFALSDEQRSQNGSKAMAMKYADPEHPELGTHPAPVLVRMQKKRGYPHGPENRVRVK